MPTYISLVGFTDQGIRTIKDTTKRADLARAAAARFGCQITQIYWTLGQHDLVLVTEAPDDATLSAFGLSLASLGNTRTQTMRAFSQDEMNAILAKMG